MITELCLLVVMLASCSPTGGGDSGGSGGGGGGADGGLVDGGAADGGATDGGADDGGSADGGAGDGGASLTWASISADDTRVRYVGRWDQGDPTAPRVGWQGASATLRFSGTALSVDLSVGRATEYFRAIIDGDDAGSVKFPVGSERATYTLAEGLDAGEHDVRLVKETYAGTLSVLYGFEVLGEPVDPAPAPSRRIVFYGDSNLEGTSLESERNAQTWDVVGSHFTYAGDVARMFDADYQNISVGGATIGSLDGFCDRLDRLDADSVYDLTEFPPDVVVLNIGANDVGRAESAIRADYGVLLDDMRASYPDAHIVVYNARGWDSDEPANYTDEVVAARGDPDMSVATFPWFFEQWHGCETDHAGMAAALATHLQDTLGWEPGALDVVSGFGQGGDVANGGFEEVAPFGGYGWRYLDDDGVSRVVDSASAHGGDAFLRLATGASSHQPNPAEDGSVVTVTAWLRGAADGDEATVTIDFRDQDMWSTPLQTESWTESLSSEWQQFSWSATAPVGGERPVFHTRLTLTASSGTVDIDDVAMTTE